MHGSDDEADGLAGWSDDDLFAEVRARGYVVSAWGVGDVLGTAAFEDADPEDEGTRDLAARALDAIGRALEDELGRAGNEVLGALVADALARDGDDDEEEGEDGGGGDADTAAAAAGEGRA